MLSLETVFFFSIAAIVLALTPGPDMLYIATRSISQGRSAGIYSALGVHTGVLVHTMAAALGLSALIAASAVAFSIIKYAGAAYLVYIGIRTLLSNSEILEVKRVERKKLRSVFCQGLVTNLLNPKVVLFFLAFLPQFIDHSKGNIQLQLISLGLLMIVVTLPIDIAVGLLGGSVCKVINTRKNMQRKGKWLAGAVFISLGIGTAFFGNRKA